MAHIENKSASGGQAGHGTGWGKSLRLALGLLLVLSAATSFLVPGHREIDGPVWLESQFDAAQSLPFGLGIGRGIKFRTGETAVWLAGPSGPLSYELPAVKSRSLSSYKKRDSKKSKEPAPWGALDTGTECSAPLEAILIWYSKRRTQSILRSQFGMVEFKDVSELDPNRADAPVDSGRLNWYGYEPPFVQIRHFFKDAEELRFQDSMRINITLGDVACILYLRWAPGCKGSEEQAQELLSALVPAQ